MIGALTCAARPGLAPPPPAWLAALGAGPGGRGPRARRRVQPGTGISRAYLACDYLRVNSELDWPEVAARLGPARNYWLATASVSGVPHTAPVWGAVLDGALHLFTARSTVKARNIAVNPRVVVHLPDPADVLIMHGVATDLGLPAQAPAVLAALEAKYHDPADRAYLPSADPYYDVIYAIRPAAAMAWRLDDFTGSQRRWQA